MRVLEQRDGHEPGVHDEVRNEVEVEQGVEAEVLAEEEEAHGDDGQGSITDGNFHFLPLGREDRR